ncbi:MAG: hypothetical protein ACKVRO_16920 [Micropepsaceae bacterium]
MAAAAPSSVKELVPEPVGVPAAAPVADAKPKKKLKPGAPAPEPEPEPAKPTIAPAKLPSAPPSRVVSVPLPMNHGEELARKAVWAGAGIMALFVLYLIADRFVAVVTRWPATVMEAVAPAHCDQFIALAKTAYGENWKVRLDPRDTTCDHEVKNEWERQRLTRYVPPPEPLFAPAAVAAAVKPQEMRPSAPATRCLNVVSLAQAKHGAEWRAKLAADDPECAGGKPKAAPVPAIVATDTAPAPESAVAVEPAPAPAPAAEPVP